MNTFYWTVLIILLGFFVVTGILTLLAIARFGPDERPLVTMDPKYLGRLFTSLLLEVVVLVITIGGLAVNGLRESSKNMDKSSSQLNKALANLEASILRETNEIINEPSGLTSFEKGGLYGLVVDDEEPLLFVVAPSDNDLRFRRTLRLEGMDPEDLEAVTWDRQSWFYATTSFRQLGDEGKATRQLLRFEIPEDWMSIEYVAQPQARDISEDLRTFLSSNGIAVDRGLWEKRAPQSDRWHPWALEIEGLAIRNDELLIGLKWPLSEDGKAVLVAYSWEDREFTDVQRLSLDGKGISDLAYRPLGEILLVAANPPAKERRGNEHDEKEHLGKSSLYVYSWPTAERLPRLLHTVHAIARIRAKLEGVSIVGDEVWLTYDGPNHDLARQPISILELDRTQ